MKMRIFLQQSNRSLYSFITFNCRHERTLSHCIRKEVIIWKRLVCLQHSLIQKDHGSRFLEKNGQQSQVLLESSPISVSFDESSTLEQWLSNSLNQWQLYPYTHHKMANLCLFIHTHIHGDLFCLQAIFSGLESLFLPILTTQWERWWRW